VRRSLYSHQLFSKGAKADKKLELSHNIKPFSPRRSFDKGKTSNISRTYKNAKMVKTNENTNTSNN
jgi:hypothetical protein